MGVEDWELKYKLWRKGSLNDFLDKEECDLDAEVTHFTNTSQDSTISQQPLKTKVKTSLNPAYPEGYDTIDRRRRKKVREPFGLVSTRTELIREDLFNPDLALLRQKRGELVLRQVAEMEEKEEKMMPCLRPYKNGLFYKTRMQAKNKLDNTLHDYMAFQDEEETRHRLNIVPNSNSEGSDEIQGSEEELEEFCSEISQHFKHYKKDSSFGGCIDKLQVYCDKTTAKGKTGEWTPEVMLSPVEEPHGEFVDPIDELQCLVETVSEYLAEKEEEISKYGSLSETNKSRLSSQASARIESSGDNQGVTSKDLNEDQAIKLKERSEQGSGKKNAMNSFFSSFTDKIVSSKQTRSNSDHCTETSDCATGSSGLSKLLSFMTKSPCPAPVAVVSPTQETLSDKRKFLMPTRLSDAKQQEIMSNPQKQNSNDLTNQNVNECQPSTFLSSKLIKVKPQNCFSEGGVNETNKHFLEVSRNELNTNHRLSGDQSNNMHSFRQNEDQTTVFIHTKTDNSKNILQKATSDTGFFSPLKKSFSSLISPVPSMPPHHQTQTVFPVFRTENKVREAKSIDALSPGKIMEVPLHDSNTLPSQQPPKTERAMFSGLMKFASSDASELKSAINNTVKPAQTVASRINTAANVSSNPNKARSPAQNPAERPMVTSETSWFSSLFKTAPNENVQTASLQGQRLVNQSSRQPTGLSQDTVRSEHHKPVKAVNEQVQQTLNGALSTAEPHTSQPERQGLFCTLFKSSFSDGTAGPKTGQHFAQRGLSSGIMKLASNGDMSKGTESNPVHLNNEPSQTTNPAQTHSESQSSTPQQHQAPNPPPNGVPLVSFKEPPQHKYPTDYQLAQQPPPTHQASSQQESILSGLFKLVSSDSLSNNQTNSSQHQNVPASPQSSHQPSEENIQGHQLGISKDLLERQKTIEGSSRHSDRVSQPASDHGGFLSGLFKFSSENVSATHSASTQQSTSKNLRQSSLEGKSNKPNPPQVLEDTQSGILSVIFNKFRASSEEVGQSKLAPPDQKQQLQSAQNGFFSQNVQSYKQQTQLQALTRDQNSPGSECQSVKCMNQRASVTTAVSLISNIIKEHSNEFPLEPEMEMGKETNDLAVFASQPYSYNGTFGNNRSVYGDDNNLDLRTSARYECSQQINAAYNSNITGHLPDSSFLNHVKISTDNLPSSPLCLTGQVYIPQPFLRQSDPSLYIFQDQHVHHNNLFYGLDPNREHYWSQNSVPRGQLNNQSLRYDPWESFEAWPELSQSLIMNVDENQLYYSTHDCMAFNNFQENNLKQQEYRRNTSNNLNVQKMWGSHNSLDIVDNFGSCIEGGALNLNKKGNSKYSSSQSFSEESCCSLNSVAYPEGYYEEHPTNLSYSANRENVYTRTYRQPAVNECYPGLNDCSNGWNYTSEMAADMEDYSFFEDMEWYQQWLLLLEQGMWWPADDGDCGYFVYTDHEYIYALLTDGSGQYVYVCAPEDEVWDNRQMSDNYPYALLNDEMVMVCGFKIPLYNEDELFWFPGQDQNEAQLLNAPLDLSDAYRKGNEIMNMNLERFSQMFESSIPDQRQQAMDFSLYRLNKVKMDTKHGSADQDPFLEVLDLRVNGTNCNLNNSRNKELLYQKVCISISPTQTTHSSGVYNCYQPHQRRHSSSGIQIKHVDDTSEEEWRKRVQPGVQPKKPINKISSLFSSFVGKSQESESHRNTTGSKTAINATHCGVLQEKSEKPSVPETQSVKKIKCSPSTGLQDIKSKTIKNDGSPSVIPKESTNQQISEMRSPRILPTIPSSVSAQGAIHKPKLARQATVSQQSSVHEVSTNSTTQQVPIQSVSSIDTQGGEKPSEQNQGGFIRFFRNAMGIEEPNQESVRFSQPVTKQTEKNKYALDDVKDSVINNGKGMRKLLGSVGELLNMENSTSHLPSEECFSQKSSAQHHFGSINDAKETGHVYRRTFECEGIRKPQRESRYSLGSQSDITQASPQEQMPKSVSQIFTPNVNDGPISGGFHTMPPTSCNKSEPSTKSTNTLFGFSFAISGRTNNKEETAGRGLLSMFSDSSPQQVAASQYEVGGESAKNTTDNRILSLFASSNTEKAPVLKQATENVPKIGTSSMGLLSMFNATSTQQTSTLHSGSSSQDSSPKEAPGKKHVFSGPNLQQNSSPTMSTNQASSNEIVHHDPPKTTSQETGSIFGGMLGGISTFNERPVKSLFSRLGGTSPQPSSTPQPTTVPKADAEIPEKVSPKQLPGVDVIDGVQKPQLAATNFQEEIPQKESPGKGILSLFGVHSPQENTSQATPILSGILSGSSGNNGTAKGLLSMFSKPSNEQKAKTYFQINAHSELSPGESSVENEQSTKSSVKYMSPESSAPTPQQPDYIDSALPEGKLPNFSTVNQPYSIRFATETPGTGFLSMVSEGYLQSNESPSIQTCSSTETASAVPKDITSIVDTISVPMESTSNLPTPPICSAPEVTSQNAVSGLLSMFNVSSTKNTAPQSGSVLDGIFPGNTGQKDIPGKSLFSMFSGPSSKSSSDVEDHETSASKEPPGKGLFSMFGVTKPQEASSPTSLLGGILPSGITAKDVSGRGLLSMFAGSSPTPPPSKTETTSKPLESGGKFNVSSFFYQGSASKEKLFSDEKKIELNKSSVMGSGHSGGDQKTADTVSDDSTKSIDGSEQMILLPQSGASKQNVCPSITTVEEETIEVTATVERKDIMESFSGELARDTCSLPEQNEKQNLPQNEIQPQPKQEGMTAPESVTAEKESHQKTPDVEKSVFDASADVVSGFMSKVFSGASSGGPSKTSSGLFSSAQTSFLKSTFTKESQSQQTTSLFGFPSSLPTNTLKSDFLGMFKSHETDKPAKASLSTPSTEFAVQDQRVSNPPRGPSSGDIKLTGNLIGTESDLAHQPQHQVIESDDLVTNLTPASVNSPEDTSLTLNDEDIKSHTVIGKPLVIGEPEDTVTDESRAAQQPPVLEQPQSFIFGKAGLSPPKFSFLSESEDARKSIGSLFSSVASKGLSTMPQTDGGGLLSGFKSFSTSLFSEEKPIASNNEPASLFGSKIGLWQKETPISKKMQTPDVTAQSNSPGYSKSTSHETDLSLLDSKEIKENVNEIIHGTVSDLDCSEFENQNKSIGSVDESKLQISISTLEIDCPSQNEQESQIRLPTSAADFSGLQQEYKELLIGKRLVAS